MAGAACGPETAVLFFPTKGVVSDTRTAEAVALCHRCPVRAECLAYALRIGEVRRRGGRLVAIEAVWAGIAPVSASKHGRRSA